VIDREREPVTRIPVAEQQASATDDHLLHRRQKVHDVRFDEYFVLGLPNGQ
jgi:hypothetical protein